MFRGNMEFTSPNQMKFYTTSRRDDLISLFYLMIFMFKRGEMPGFGRRSNLTNGNGDFQLIFKAKKKMRTSDLCFDNTKDLSKFKREVFSYHFKDEPNYEILRKMLEKLRDKSLASKQDPENTNAISLLKPKTKRAKTVHKRRRSK